MTRFALLFSLLAVPALSQGQSLFVFPIYTPVPPLCTDDEFVGRVAFQYEERRAFDEKKPTILQMLDVQETSFTDTPIMPFSSPVKLKSVASRYCSATIVLPDHVEKLYWRIDSIDPDDGGEPYMHISHCAAVESERGEDSCIPFSDPER